jgi:hypothetical protein
LKIDALSSAKGMTPYGEMVPEFFFGHLAHSTTWHSSEVEQREPIGSLLQEGLATMNNMRACPGLVCVADLGFWSVLRMTYDGPGLIPADLWEARRVGTGHPPEGVATVSYMRHVEGNMGVQHAPLNAISAAIAAILGRLAHGDSSVRPLSQYFLAAGPQGSGTGTASRAFSPTDYSSDVRARLPAGLTNGIAGSEWGMVYPF